MLQVGTRCRGVDAAAVRHPSRANTARTQPLTFKRPPSVHELSSRRSPGLREEREWAGAA